MRVSFKRIEFCSNIVKSLLFQRIVNCLILAQASFNLKPLKRQADGRLQLFLTVGLGVKGGVPTLPELGQTARGNVSWMIANLHDKWYESTAPLNCC